MTVITVPIGADQIGAVERARGRPRLQKRGMFSEGQQRGFQYRPMLRFDRPTVTGGAFRQRPCEVPGGHRYIISARGLVEYPWHVGQQLGGDSV